MKTLATPVPPIKKAPRTPECYKEEKQKGGWYYWLIPSRQDPRNAFLANWAPWMAAIEWIALVGSALFIPNVCGGSTGYSTLVLIPGTFGILACWGYRGMVAGYARKIASSILFYTNAPLFLLFELDLLKMWWDYRE
jgi:hypothetical protein